jgi:hypothetical protein
MITKDDIKDIDLVDAIELASTGSAFYRTGITLVSTTTGTNLVTVNGSFSIIYGDDPIEVGDIVVISGTTGGADGTYTVASIVTDQTFTVSTPIATSTGGSAGFKNKAGALRVGVDSTTFTQVTGLTVQALLKDIDSKLGDRAYRRHFLLMGS